MNPATKTLLLGLALTGGSIGQQPTAQPRSYTVSELGPAVSGNLLREPPVPVFYDFDSAPGVDDGTDLDGWIDLIGESAPGSEIFSNDGNNDGGRGTGGEFNSSGNQDADHPTLVMSSPPFKLMDDMSISFDIAGGMGTTTFPADLASIPAASLDDGTGFQGMALRRLADNSYVLWDTRNANGNGYQTNGWDAATLAAVSATYPGESFVLDWIDYYHGSWGFGMVDNVAFQIGTAPGNVPLVSPELLVGTANLTWGGTLETTLSDGFAYNPLTPTNPAPYQGNPDQNRGFHNDDAAGAELEYQLETPFTDTADNQLVVDLYGRNTNFDRDNQLTIQFWDGPDPTGSLLGQRTLVSIPDAAPYHVRVSSDSANVPTDSVIGAIRIVSTNSLFTLLEIRAGEVRDDYNIVAGTIPVVIEVNGEAANVGTPITLPSGAELTVSFNGDFTYDPNGAFSPTGASEIDSFTYTINYTDPGTPTTATVEIDITDADALVYVDDDWTGLTAGDPIADADSGTSGAQPATFGTDAFATILGGVDAANANATVVVNGGTYPESFGLPLGKNLTITGTDAAQTVTIDSLVAPGGSSVEIQGASVLTLAGGNLQDPLTGTGSLAKTGTGTLTLRSSNSHTGGTELGGGVLALAGTGDLGPGPVTITGGSEISAANDVTIAGTLGGSAPLEVSGAAVTLGGSASGFTDTITVTGGLVIPSGNTVGGSVAVLDDASIGGEGTISGNLALGTAAGPGSSTLIIDETTAAEVLTADTLTLNTVVTLDGINTVESTVAVLSYVNAPIDNQTGTASLGEAFDVGGVRGTVVDNSQTIEVTVGAAQTAVFTATESDVWEVGGPAANWNTTDTFFYHGDSVVFDDTVLEAFLDIVTVDGAPAPNGITFNNSSAQDYTFNGATIEGSGPLIKNNDGTVIFDNNLSITGEIIVNGGLLRINNIIRDIDTVTVNSGATFATNSTNFFVATHDPAVAQEVIVDGGTWHAEAGHDARVGSFTLANGGTFISDRPLTAWDFLLANTPDGAATVTVTGSGAAVMMGSGGIHLQGVQNFDVAEVTGDPADDLLVSLILDGPGNSGGAAGGINKLGAGTMFLSGANTYNGETIVSEGCLSLANLAAIPQAGLTGGLVSVASGAGFGGIVGASNLSDADLQSIAANVSWASGSFLVIDTDGADVTVAADLVGSFGLLKKGLGELTLTGDNNFDGAIVVEEGTVDDQSGSGDVQISITSVSRDGTTVTLGFSSPGGNVDVYASDDLGVTDAWTMIGDNVAPSTFQELNVTSVRRFYVLVSTGEVFP